MENLSLHMRISAVAVSDDDVNSRRSAATTLAASWKKENNVSKIISKAVDVASALSGDGHPSSALGIEVQGVIQKKSSSYLFEERPLDVGVCAGMAMVSMLSGEPGRDGWTILDIYANALQLALAYQPVLEDVRRENLRREVLTVATNWCDAASEKARERIDVPDPAEVEITVEEEGKTTHNIKEAMKSTVSSLRRNAALDREELDFLWWAQLNRSRLLKTQLSNISEPLRIVATGIEAATLLRRFPCEVHRELVLRTLDLDPELDALSLLEAIGEERTLLGEVLNVPQILSYPTVFPLLSALRNNEAPGQGAAVKRRVSEWGVRALSEAGFAKMILNGEMKL